ncbi:hypothetical protein C8F01DRAFT_1340018 [Mycena amicta]|nr:hypothetical protein C8F01DRAFT_1340018 [Mycena amicta]
MSSKAAAKGKKKKATSGIALPTMGGEEDLGTGEVVLAKIGLLPLLPGMIAAVSELPPFMLHPRPTTGTASSKNKKDTDIAEKSYPVRFFPKGDYESKREAMQVLATGNESNAESDAPDTTTPAGKGSEDKQKSPPRKTKTTALAPVSGSARKIGPKSRTVGPKSRAAGLPNPKVGPTRRKIGPSSRIMGSGRQTGEREREKDESEAIEVDVESEEEMERDVASTTHSNDDGESVTLLTFNRRTKRAALEEPLIVFEPPTRKKGNTHTRGQKATEDRAAKRRKIEDGMYTISRQRMEELQNDPDANLLVKWRRELQAALFSQNDDTVERSAELLRDVDNIFKSLAWFGTLTMEYLAYSKLLTVMKRIAFADDGPILRADEHRFYERAAAFVVKWEAVLGGRKIED